MITIGSTSSDTVIASNDTGSIGTTAEPIKLVFADYVLDPDNTGALSYQIKFRLTVTSGIGTSYYWQVSGQQWVTSATQGVNEITGTVQGEWRFNEVSIDPPPVTGTAKVELFIGKEDIYNNSNFRVYYDDVVLKSISDLEYYDTSTKIIDTSFKENSGVLKAVENRFGMLDDIKYSNNLVDSNGNSITAYKNFDQVSGATLETLMNFQRLNEFTSNNFRYEGTFRKIADSDGFTKPIDVSKNRYKLSTHIPTQDNLTAFGQISSNTDFYRFKPED
jgi:hypothetical protein